MGSPLPEGMKQGNVRRRTHNGQGLKRYNRVWTKAWNGRLYLRSREREFAQQFVEGLCLIGSSLLGASHKRVSLVLRKLAMDCIEAGSYRCKGEKALNRQALYLMNMPRVQMEMDRIMTAKGMSKERMAARLAEIMDGRATTTVTKYDGSGIVVEKTVATASISESLRAIDLVVRATTGYAPTSSKVAVGMDMSNVFDPQTFDQTPEIAVDPSIALEAKAEKQQEESEEDDGGVEDEEEEDNTCEDCGKDYDDCECEDDDNEDDEGHE